MLSKMRYLLDGRDFKILLIFLLSVLTISSLVTETTQGLLIFNILFSLLLFIASNCLILDLKLFYWGLLLAFLSLFCTFAVTANFDIKYLLIYQHLSYFVFFALILYHILNTLFNSVQIDLNIVFGAMSGYIIIGLMGSFLMIIINELYPASLTYTNGGDLTHFDYLYFSFVNMTTLGLGDIIPKRPPAKGLIIIHTLVGQLYLSVIVAIMVGKYIVHNNLK